MLIATSHSVYAAPEDCVPFEPEERFSLSGVKDEKIACLEEGEKVSAIGLKNGDIVLLEGDKHHRLASGIKEELACLTLLEEEPLLLLIGTEEANLYHLSDGLKNGGKPAQLAAGFAQLECRQNWYTPWGGPPAVRSLAHSPDWLYADIHVGSIMRSPDRGLSWEPVNTDIHEDVHQVVTAEDGRVYANTAAAVYCSADAGASWEHRSDGLSSRYGRAIAVHPGNADCVLATVSNGPGSQVDGRLFRSGDGGRSWTHITTGFPATSAANIDTFQVAFGAAGMGWAAVDRALYASADQGLNWEEVWQAPEAIAMISCV